MSNFLWVINEFHPDPSWYSSDRMKGKKGEKVVLPAKGGNPKTIQQQYQKMIVGNHIS